MTITSAVNRSGPYIGDGYASEFDCKFRVFDRRHVKVVRDISGVETVLELDTHYTVTGVGAAQGTIVLTAPLPVGHKLTLLPSLPFTQEIDLEDQGAYYAETIERGFDLAVMRDLQLKEMVGRAVMIPPSIGLPMTITPGSEGESLAFDASGNLVPGPSISSVHTASQTAVEAAAAAEAASTAAAEDADRSSNGADQSEAARDLVLAAVPNVYVATRAALKTLPSATRHAYLTEMGVEGLFIWRDGDFSARVAVDTKEAVFIKANHSLASAGAWVRVHDGEYLAKWFGAKGDNLTDDRAALQAAIDLCLFTARPTPLVLTGMCRVNASLIVNRAVGTAAGGDTFFVRGRGIFAGLASGLAGDIIDTTLPWVAPYNSPPACNITFEHITWQGIGGTTVTRCVSGKFLKVDLHRCRFNSIRCVQTPYYLQSWYITRCSMIATPGIFISAIGRLYDFVLDNSDFESCADGVKCWEDGIYGGRITNNLFENSGKFFSQAKGYGLTISGNYTEHNSGSDYQLSDPFALGGELGVHHGTAFFGNFMGHADHAGFAVLVGKPAGMMAGGNVAFNCDLYDTTYAEAGSFRSIGDHADVGIKFSHPGFFDAEGAGTHVVGTGSSGALATGAAKTLAIVTLKPGDWDISGVAVFTPGATTNVTGYTVSISTTDNSHAGGWNKSIDVLPPHVPVSGVSKSTPVVRLSLTVATAVYIVASSNFTENSMSAVGQIRARRAGGV